MIYAKSMEELVDMLKLLLPEFASIGLELNVSKQKIDQCLSGRTVFCRSGT
jgi:hypothetical protein